MSNFFVAEREVAETGAGTHPVDAAWLQAWSPPPARGGYAGPERRATAWTGPWRGPAGARHRADAATALAGVLDEVDHGLVLLDASARVLHANHAARTEMGGDHPLQDLNGQLVARSAQDRGALRLALLGASRDRRRCLLTLQGPGRSGQAGRADRPVQQVAVVPMCRLPSGAAGATAAPRPDVPLQGPDRPVALVLLVFGKREACEPLSLQWFAQQHRLTVAEAQVLQALCQGAAPAEVAARQAVALSTVRTQIASIRGKTGAQSLRALMRQVAVLPPLVSALRPGRLAPD